MYTHCTQIKLGIAHTVILESLQNVPQFLRVRGHQLEQKWEEVDIAKAVDKSVMRVSAAVSH